MSGERESVHDESKTNAGRKYILKNGYYFSYMVKVLPLLGPLPVRQPVVDDFLLAPSRVNACDETPTKAPTVKHPGSSEKK